MREALVYAVGVAISPVAVAAVLWLLTCPRAVANAISFLVGWTFVVAAATVVLVLLVDQAGLTDSDPLWISLAELVIGAAFLLAGLAVWRQRHDRQPGSVPWVSAVDAFTMARSAGLGVVLSAANPKVVALSLGAAFALMQADTEAGVAAKTIVLYSVIGAAGVSIPVALYLSAPHRVSSLLARLRSWLSRHETTILTTLGVLIGATFLVDGLDNL